MTTSYDVSRKLVSDLGGDPSNTAIVRAVAIWLAYESGTTIYGNNPWNMRPTTLPPGTCTRGVDGKNFLKFCTIDDGVRTAAFQLNKDDYRGYRAISDAIRAGNSIAFFRALAKSKWSSDHYGGGSKLIAAFMGGTNYNRNLTFKDRSGGTNTGGGGSSVGGGSTGGAIAVVTDWWKQLAASINVGLDDPLNQAQAQSVSNALATKSINIPASDLVGKTINQIAGGFGGNLGGLNLDVGGAIAGLGETVGDVVLTFTVVIIGLVFIIGAIVLYRGSSKASE